MKIAILVGSTRPGRSGSAVGQWAYAAAKQRDDAEFELVELADFDLDLLDDPTVPGAANRNYVSPKTRAWGARIDEFDGFCWVTPEYNHGVPAAMKNAVDVLYPEWNHKAVGFVSYGADAGVRAVEQWRTILANLHMVDVRAAVALSSFLDWTDGEFKPLPRRSDELTTMLDQLVGMCGVVGAMRG